MNIPFNKYHGTGNDFILIDNRSTFFKPNKKLIAFLCDRNYGIGADGLITLEKSKGLDFAMHYFNADGNESTMCGNGGRCITAFAQHLGIIKDNASFSAIDGEHTSIITKNNDSTSIIKLKMSNIASYKKIKNDFIIDSGSPHYVKFINKLESLNVFTLGEKIRHDKKISKNGVNVDFVEYHPNKIHVRTYERGVENETLSCGTGAVASAIATSILKKSTKNKIAIQTLGGELSVEFKRKNDKFHDIWLTGPATLVFIGEFLYL